MLALLPVGDPPEASCPFFFAGISLVSPRDGHAAALPCRAGDTSGAGALGFFQAGLAGAAGCVGAAESGDGDTSSSLLIAGASAGAGSASVGRLLGAGSSGAAEGLVVSAGFVSDFTTEDQAICKYHQVGCSVSGAGSAARSAFPLASSSWSRLATLRLHVPNHTL